MMRIRSLRLLSAVSILSMLGLAAACGGSSGNGGGAGPDGGSPDSSMGHTDSGTGSNDSGTGSNDSGTGSNDSGTGTGDSGMGTGDSGMGTGDSGDTGTGNAEGGALASATAKKVVAGFQHACALTTTGAVRCWGYADHGQVGNGVLGATPIDTPVQVTGLTSGVIDISTSADHTCAVTSTGGVKCWGANDQGQLGNLSMNDSAVPIDVAGVTGITAISAGQAHTCALGGGVVTCWGANDAEQLGMDTSGAPSTPVAVPGLAAGVTMVSAGFEQTCVVTAGGGAQCWGGNTFGELGQGGSGGSVIPPAAVTGLTTGIAAVSAGYNHSCALTTAGAILCWGLDDEGELGNNMSGVSVEFDTPVSVSGITSGATSLSVGVHYACAVVAGAAKCWGDGSSGELGNGADNESDVPAQVTGLASGTAQVSAGSLSCAVLSSGAVKCWGSNSGGQLGDGLDGTNNAQTESNVPVAVLSLP